MIVGRKAGVAPQLLAAVVRIYTVRHVVDATLRPREPKVSQVPQVLLVQVNAQRPNAAVHRHQKQVLVAALLRCWRGRITIQIQCANTRLALTLVYV